MAFAPRPGSEPHRSYDTAKVRQQVIFSGPGDKFLIGDPSNWTRYQKLAYVESSFARDGMAAGKNRFVMECRISPRLSATAYNEARAYGLWLHNRRNQGA